MELRRLAPLLLIAACGCVSDLRPSSIEDGPPDARETAIARGRVEAAARRQGLDAWRETAETRLELRDLWDSGLMAFFAVPWEPGTRLALRTSRGADAGELTYLEGDRAGCTHLRRADGSSAYRLADGSVEETSSDEVADFFIPAIGYQHDFPFRILEATEFVDAGVARFAGREFDVVFCSWSMDADLEHDQYRVWIARDTGRIEVIEYTSREEFRFSKYFTVFDEFREVSRIETPRRITILTELDTDYVTDFLHRFEIDSVAYGRHGGPTSRPAR